MSDNIARGKLYYRILVCIYIEQWNKLSLECNSHRLLVAKCNSSNVGETSRYLSTSFREHLLTVKNSKILKHLRSSNKCKMAFNEDCLTILYSATTYHHLKSNEALHNMWEKPISNKQVQHFDVLLNF